MLEMCDEKDYYMDTNIKFPVDYFILVYECPVLGIFLCYNLIIKNVIMKTEGTDTFSNIRESQHQEYNILLCPLGIHSIFTH
jgi:hypothetical protein